ncbi:MAG: winged helix-turn-helix transcriptional regulator [Saprospiraceae bacterium]|nr:winged helix-turn-helix transcriptional regulator [Saprospiraceae bacterium]
MMSCRSLAFTLSILLVSTSLLWSQSETPGQPEPDQVNLALRRMADALLRASRDSVSRIPAIEQTGPLVWRVQLDQSFKYDALPGFLQASLDRHGITQPYQVAVRRCEDNVIDLGYHQFDWLDDSLVPCQGRAFSEECHFIEITFTPGQPVSSTTAGYWWVFWLLVGGGLASVYFLVQPRKRSDDPTTDESIPFGNSRLDVAGQHLICGNSQQHLTYRETKLLDLFVQHANQILERDFILQHVWADEGVLVGRSVDVFVSRLRKKLAMVPMVTIAAVHGIGYRLEIATGPSSSSEPT